jgi:hypothetical protein
VVPQSDVQALVLDNVAVHRNNGDSVRFRCGLGPQGRDFTWAQLQAEIKEHAQFPENFG